MPEGRRLAAIMFTDIVGYTAMMGSNVEKALDLLHKNREIQKAAIEKYNGKWLKEMGDGILAQFHSAIDSVRCALEIQRRAHIELDGKIRIGIHLGDVTVENEDVFGDGVNIASRLQAIADPGGIYISESIQHAIRGSTDIRTQFFGEIQLKNVDYLVKTYYLEEEDLPVPSKSKMRQLAGKGKKPLLKSVYTYLIAFLIVAVGGVSFWINQKKAQELDAIAVLPVENISNKSDQQWLEAGIHRALIDEISKIQSLRVISRTSTLKYKNSEKAIPEIAEELNVDGIVEASFSTEGENINLQVRLFQAQPEERQLWRHVYDEAMKNVLVVYGEVAKAVALASNISLSEQEESFLSSAREINPKAYEAYLRGMSYWELGTKADLDRALNYFELALDIDPDYALAWLGVSRTWGGYMQHGFMPASEALPKSNEAKKIAFELDSNLVEIRAGMATRYTWGDWDWEKAGIEFRKALEINPNYAFAQAYYAHYLAIVGETEKGIPHGERAVKIDPFNSLYRSILGMTLKNARKYEEAKILLEKLTVDEPEQGIGLPALWAVYHELGDYEAAIRVAKKVYAIKGIEAAIEAIDAGYNEGGYKKAMQRTAEVMIARSDTTFVTPWQICTLYCRAEMKEEALTWLEKSYDEHDVNMPYIRIDPLFDFIRDDERFKVVYMKMNYP